MKRWIPRATAIIVIGFFSVFTLDVFDQPQWFLAWVIHMIPSWLMIGATAVAWKNERVGGGLWMVLGVVMGIYFHSLILAIPAMVTGGLFLASKHKK